MDPNKPVPRRNVLVRGPPECGRIRDRCLRKRTVVPDSEALDGGGLGRLQPPPRRVLPHPACHHRSAENSGTGRRRWRLKDLRSSGRNRWMPTRP